jgi:signal transduction histidine kinase
MLRNIQRKDHSTQVIAVADGDREEKARQAMMGERASDYMDFIATISHELRAPLASIMGYVDLMLDEETGPLNEEQSQYLDVIKSNVEHLSHLINSILDLSRIEAGHIGLAMIPLDVIEIAKETMITMQPQAQAKDIEMTLSVAKNLPLTQGDPDRIRQVLVNVLDNAIKFTPHGGRVEISAQRLAAGEQPPPPGPVLSEAEGPVLSEAEGPVLSEAEGPVLSEAEGPKLAATSDWLLISVTDTGVGIAAKEQDRIFDRFCQVEGFAERRSRGSGLGLSIARGVIEAHGGLIWAQSAGENQGSTFTFALPV